MKRIVITCLLLGFALFFSACGGSGENPITTVKPGMTMEEVLAVEPDLAESSKTSMLHCKRSFGGTEGWLFVNFVAVDSGQIALNVGWDAEPQENGKKIYRELLSELKSCYGRPTATSESKASKWNSTVVLKAFWNTETNLARVYYSQDSKTGESRIEYVMGAERIAK